MDVNILLKIGGVGILVAVINQVLSKAGRDDQTMYVSLAGSDNRASHADRGNRQTLFNREKRFRILTNRKRSVWNLQNLSDLPQRPHSYA